MSKTAAVDPITQATNDLAAAKADLEKLQAGGGGSDADIHKQHYVVAALEIKLDEARKNAVYTPVAAEVLPEAEPEAHHAKHK